MNHIATVETAQISLAEGWRFKELLSYCGGEVKANESGVAITLPANTGAVAVVEKK